MGKFAIVCDKCGAIGRFEDETQPQENTCDRENNGIELEGYACGYGGETLIRITCKCNNTVEFSD